MEPKQVDSTTPRLVVKMSGNVATVVDELDQFYKKHGNMGMDELKHQLDEELGLLDLERAADAAAQARLDWFKAQRELQPKPVEPTADVDNCYRVTWTIIRSIAEDVGVDFNQLNRSIVSDSMHRQIDIRRVILVALADAYERAQQ